MATSLGILYPFAFDEDENLVIIHSIVKERRYDHKYSCPSCGQEMRPRLGEKRARCFYHYHSIPCDSESYIHRVGKELLYRRFTDSHAAFIVEYNQSAKCDLRDSCSCIRFNSESPCNSISERKLVDLKGLFDTADIEKEYTTADGTSFRPDVLLSNKTNPNQRPLFLEIDYKHPCSETKIRSGVIILEFKVSNIVDLPRISSARVFSENNSSISDSFPVRLYNSDKICSQDEILMMLPDKEAFVPCTKEYQDRHPRNETLDCVLFYPSGYYRSKVIQNLEEAHDEGACYSVSYYRSNVDFSPRAVIAIKDVRFRDCGICSHYSRKNGRDMCELALCKSKFIRVFDQNTAKTCNGFTIKKAIMAACNSYVEGRDFYIWINPLF